MRVTSKDLSNWSSTRLPEDDDSWVEVPVEQRDGTWVALVDHTDVPAGSTISIAVEGTVDGASVEQYLLSLYAVS